MAISALGVGSGLDLGALLDQMRAAENQRLVPLQNQQKSLTAQLSAWGTVKSSVSKLQTAAENLQKANNISLNTVKSDNTTFKATIDSKAVAGDYRVKVNNLATADFKSANVAGVTDANAKSFEVPEGGAVLKIGDAEIKLDEGNYSLNDLRTKINASDAGVNAQVINGTEGTFLSLTSQKTGVEGNISEIKLLNKPSDEAGSVEITSGNLANLANGLNDDNNSRGKDAEIELNGILISSSTNEFKNVLNGVTINVSKRTAEGADPETLTISKDTTALKDALKAYVTAYNEIQDTIKTQTKFVPGKVGEDLSSDNGALMGNNTVRTLQNQLRGQLSATQEGDFRTLNQLGIRLGSDGKLSIDDKTLDKALADNPDGVVKFLVGDGQTTGFATQSANQLKQMTNTTSGLFKNQEDSINAMKRRVDDNIDRITQSIENNISNMRTQFEQLDKMMADMSSTSAYLTQQLSSLM